MCLHDLIVKEFEQTKSLSALIYLIEHGREIEFLFEGRKYFLSHSNSQKKVSVWSNKEELIEKAIISDTATILDVLPQVQIETIF